MAAALRPFFVAASTAPALGVALSGVFGSISLTAWICLLLPQLITNYKNQSADGLSMAFLFVWLVGDIANLSGALFTSLAPTAVALAAYFCIADLVLIAQCVYYNTLNARRAARARARARRAHHRRALSGTPGAAVASSDEDEPLLARQRSDSSAAAGLPGSHRRPSMRRRRHSSVSGLDPLARIITGEDETPDASPWLHNALSLLAVYAVGAAGWFVSYKMGAWDADAPAPDVPDPAAGEGAAQVRGGSLAAVGLALGYASAACYLCARIPQIVKNWREKSCEGLALLFFLLSLTGNLTYGASLFAYSQDRAYLLKALPWLLGSLGTVVEDCVIFVQFRLYAPERAPKAGADGA